MKVLIPTAGFGTRLRPHTYSRPKPLVNVAGRPVIGRLIDSFEGLDVDEFIIITGWLGDQIEKYLVETYPDKTFHFYEQVTLDGQSTAIHLAREVIDGPLVTLFVDTICDVDLGFLADIETDGVAFVKAIDDPRRFGIAATDDSGIVTRFVEKPDSMDDKLAVIGMYYFKEGKDLIAAIEQQIAAERMVKGEYYIVEALQIMIEGGAKFAVKEVETWLDAGTVEAALETNRLLLESHDDNSASVQAKNSAIIPPVNVHPSAQISGSVIGPHVTIGANCVVKDSIVRDSIIDLDTTVESLLLEHSLLGQHTELGGRFQSLNIGDTARMVDRK